jgi:hypothetical protein
MITVRVLGEDDLKREKVRSPMPERCRSRSGRDPVQGMTAGALEDYITKG